MLIHSVRRVPSPKASSFHRIPKPPQLYSSTSGASARVTVVSETRGVGAPTVKLTTVGAPTPRVSETTGTRGDAPAVLEDNGGGLGMRRELGALGGWTRLTLWMHVAGPYI